MTRRTMLLALAAARADAVDPASEVWNVLTAMANALSASDSAAFLLFFDSSMPGFDSFRLAVAGLLNEFSVESSINPLQNEGDNRSRTLEVDWSMRLVSLNDLDEVVPRETNVTLKLERRGKKWKVVSFQPANFFQAPPHGGLPPQPKL